MLQSGWTSATIIPTPALNASTKPRAVESIEGRNFQRYWGGILDRENSDLTATSWLIEEVSRLASFH